MNEQGKGEEPIAGIGSETGSDSQEDEAQRNEQLILQLQKEVPAFLSNQYSKIEDVIRTSAEPQQKSDIFSLRSQLGAGDDSLLLQMKEFLRTGLGTRENDQDRGALARERSGMAGYFEKVFNYLKVIENLGGDVQSSEFVEKATPEAGRFVSEQVQHYLDTFDQRLDQFITEHAQRSAEDRGDKSPAEEMRKYYQKNKSRIVYALESIGHSAEFQPARIWDVMRKVKDNLVVDQRDKLTGEHREWSVERKDLPEYLTNPLRFDTFS